MIRRTTEANIEVIAKILSNCMPFISEEDNLDVTPIPMILFIKFN